MGHYLDVWEDKNIKGYEKFILIYLMEQYNETDGYSNPTRKQIQEATGIAKNTLIKVLNSLETKGYITRVNNPKKSGRNNIYYIHKYLVISSDKSNVPDVSEGTKLTEPDAKSCEKDTKVNTKLCVNDIKKTELSTNELLVKERVKLKSKITDLVKEQLKELDTDILIRAIENANKCKPEGYYIGYLLKAYDSAKNNPSEPRREDLTNKQGNNSNSNKKFNTEAFKGSSVKTKYHGTFNEHFRKYSEAELEENLLKIQAKKRKIKNNETA